MGFTTVNRTVVDVPPPGAGLVTAKSMGTAVSSMLVGSVTSNEVGDTNTDSTGAPLAVTLELPAKPVPVRNTRLSGLRACNVSGVTADNVGSALVIVNTPPSAAPPPGGGLVTPIRTSPARRRNPSVMSACNSVAETNVVGIGVPPT